MNAASAPTPAPPSTNFLVYSDNGNNGEVSPGEDAQGWLNNLQDALAKEAPGFDAEFNKPSMDPTQETLQNMQEAVAMYATHGEGGDGEAYEFQQMMQGYLHSNATANPFTHVNPTQVLGRNGGSHHGNTSAYSSPSETSPVQAVTSEQQTACGPTRPLPKSIGGKVIPTRGAKNTSSGPQRSTSSPNLAGLKISARNTTDGVTGSPSMPLSSTTPTSTHKKTGSTGAKPTFSRQSALPAEAQSGATTPTSEDGGPGSVIIGGEAPTSCTNCQTTNTPLWRRDPDGQPLCNVGGKARPGMWFRSRS